jgi:hypothetical protein
MSKTDLPADYYGIRPDQGILADPNDVATIEAIIHASYECISGEAGQPRDWERLQTLFLPDARWIRTGPLTEGVTGHKIMNTMDYKHQMNDFLVQNGFFETEIHSVIEGFGNIAHVFSTYESRRKADDKKPFMRGINSIQLLYDGTRWWVVTIMWQHENATQPIPEKYLPKS